MQTINLAVDKRSKGTKGQLNSIRKSGYVPGVLYHSGEQATTLSVKSLDLRPLIYTNESHIVKLRFSDGEEKQAILKDTDFDPITDRVIHVDFLEIRADEQIIISVPVSVVGIAEGVKTQGGTMSIAMHKIAVKCKPEHIPSHIDVDVSALEVGDSIHLSDIEKLLAGTNVSIADDPSGLVLSVASRMKEEEKAASTEAVAPESASAEKQEKAK